MIMQAIAAAQAKQRRPKFPAFDPNKAAGQARLKVKRPLVPLSYAAATKDWQKLFKRAIIVDDQILCK